VVYVILGDVSADAVGAEVESSCCCICLILLVGLERGVFPVGATVTNVTADCLHGTVVGIGKEDCDWETMRLAEKSLNNDRLQSMGMLFIQYRLEKQPATVR
jgi:hypothetical protein